MANKAKITKIILLIIVILIPIACAFGIGSYSYNRYDPEVNSNLDIEFKKDLTTKNGVTTLERIDTYRKLENYYYEKDPVFLKDVEYNNEKIYTVAIYRGLSLVREAADSEAKYVTRYDLFIYNVNYTVIKNELKKQFADPSLINDYSEPNFIVNICPTNEMDDEQSLFTNGEEETDNSVASIVMYDTQSTPQKNDKDKPYYVHHILMRENQIKNVKLFTEGKAYLSIEAQVYNDLTEDGESQRYAKSFETLIAEEISDFELKGENFNKEDMEKGWRETGIRDTLNNAGYNGWIFKKYIWWQALLALVVSSLIMVGFYFAFTYEEPKKVTKKRK